MSSPIITITIDAEKDIDRFVFFLTNEQYRAKRLRILQFYPSLRNRIENGEGSLLTVVRSEIFSMYKRFTVQLQTIVSLAKKEFSESESVFAALAQIMNFPQLENRSYVSVPTFLPFSPLENNLFYFSIAMDIAGRPHTNYSFLAIGVHEISHFIFSEQYEMMTEKTGHILNKPTYHFVKEALTAAVMNQPEIKNFFNYPSLFHSNEYPGNAELRDLFIEINGKRQQIIELFVREIIQNPDGYINGLNNLCQLLAKANEAFSEKWRLWNNQPNIAEEKQDWLRTYSQPIRLFDN
ncbi:MAG: hypothetical protein WC734_05825 [Patescibacteria group bacterium]|jgi:hypothetical protein